MSMYNVKTFFIFSGLRLTLHLFFFFVFCRLLLPFEKYQKGEKPNGPQLIIARPRKIKTEDSENGQPVVHKTGNGSTTMLVKKKVSSSSSSFFNRTLKSNLFNWHYAQ